MGRKSLAATYACLAALGLAEPIIEPLRLRLTFRARREALLAKLESTLCADTAAKDGEPRSLDAIEKKASMLEAHLLHMKVLSYRFRSSPSWHQSAAMRPLQLSVACCADACPLPK